MVSEEYHCRLNWAEQRRLQTLVKLRLKTFHCNEDVGNGSSDDVGNDSYDINDQVLELEQRKDANLTELEALRHQVNCIIINLTLNVNMSATLFALILWY